MVIKQFKNKKSPGLEGYNMEFYKVAWEIIKTNFWQYFMSLKLKRKWIGVQTFHL